MTDYVISLNTIASYVDEDSGSLILSDQNSNALSKFSDPFRQHNFSSMDDEVGLLQFMADSSGNESAMINSTSSAKYEVGYRDSLSIILPITLCYIVIFITGVLGNVITCIVIAKNKTMHTATNYYLFNLAVSDFFVLMFGEYVKCVIIDKYWAFRYGILSWYFLLSSEL